MLPIWKIASFLMVGLVVKASDQDLQFQAFNSEPGIYFEELGRASVSTTEWKFIVYFNLTSFWYEWEHLCETGNRLWAVCQGTVSQHTEIRNCYELLQPINYLMAKLEAKNLFLRAPATRIRRAPLEFIGNVLGDLFGVLDQRDAKMYHDQLQQIMAGTLHLQQLFQKQTHVLDVTANILRKEKDLIEKHYSILKKDIAETMVHEDFIDMVLQLTSALVLFKDMQSELIEVLVDIHHGKINNQLLSPPQLEELLSNLQLQLPSTIRIPTYKMHWAQIYKLLSTKAGIVQDQVIFEVRLPLLQREEFQIFKIIPVPTRHEDKFIFIEPEFQYVLVNYQRSWYYPLSREALTNCKTWDEKSVIRTPHGPLYYMNAKESHCEVTLLRHVKTPPAKCRIRAVLPTIYLQQLQQGTQWIVVLDEKVTFDLDCNQTIRPVVLQGSGVLTLTPGCTLRGRLVLITSSLTYVASRHMNYIPTFNLSREIQSRNVIVSSNGLEQDLSGLQQTIADLQQEAPWTVIDVHHITNYSLTALLFLLAIILVVLWWKRKLSWRDIYTRRMQQPLEQPTSPVKARKFSI